MDELFQISLLLNGNDELSFTIICRLVEISQENYDKVFQNFCVQPFSVIRRSYKHLVH